LITPNYTKLFKKLDKSKLNEVQIVRTPTATINLADEADNQQAVHFGGYQAIVHYNRQKEIDHSTQKMQKRLRTLRKQNKSRRYSSVGDDFPAVTLLDLGRRAIK
jgi:hypothetical protein